MLALYASDVGEMLPAMLASSGASLGTYEIAQVVQNTGSGAEAAAAIERYTYNLPSILPESMKQEIARILASSRTPQEAWHATDQALRVGGVATSAQSAAYLERMLLRAQQYHQSQRR